MRKIWHLYVNGFLIDIGILEWNKEHEKLGKNASEKSRLMQQAHGNDCLSRLNVFVWHKRFLDGRESLEDEERTGC